MVADNSEELKRAKMFNNNPVLYRFLTLPNLLQLGLLWRIKVGEPIYSHFQNSTAVCNDSTKLGRGAEDEFLEDWGFLSGSVHKLQNNAKIEQISYQLVKSEIDGICGHFLVGSWCPNSATFNFQHFPQILLN